MHATPVYCNGYEISTQTKEPELAWRLVRRLTGAESQRRMAGAGRLIPTRRDEMKRALAGIRGGDVFATALGDMVPRPAVPLFLKINSMITTRIRNDVLLRGRPVAAVVREIAESVDTLLERRPGAVKREG